MSSEFWLGLAASVPVGIGVNLISGPIGHALDRQIRRRSQRKSAVDPKFEERAIAFAEDRGELWNYLLGVGIRLSYIGALAGLVSGLFALLGQSANTTESAISAFWDYAWFLRTGAQALYMLAQLSALIGTILILNISRNALATIRRVREIRRSEIGTTPSASLDGNQPGSPPTDSAQARTTHGGSSSADTPDSSARPTPQAPLTSPDESSKVVTPSGGDDTDA